MVGRCPGTNCFQYYLMHRQGHRLVPQPPVWVGNKAAPAAARKRRHPGQADRPRIWLPSARQDRVPAAESSGQRWSGCRRRSRGVGINDILNGRRLPNGASTASARACVAASDSTSSDDSSRRTAATSLRSALTRASVSQSVAIAVARIVHPRRGRWRFHFRIASDLVGDLSFAVLFLEPPLTLAQIAFYLLIGIYDHWVLLLKSGDAGRSLQRGGEPQAPPGSGRRRAWQDGRGRLPSGGDLRNCSTAKPATHDRNDPDRPQPDRAAQAAQVQP
jgi:hypothetical protein